MSDFTHCQLLSSRLPSSAFLNMHALHFSTTFQIQMDVPCSCFFSPLLHLPLSCLCNSALFVVDPISRFDPSCGAEADCAETDWQTEKTKAHQLAGINTSAVPITVPTHPYARMNPSLSACWCQTRICVFCLDGCRHTRYPSCSSATPFHCLVWGENWRLILRFSDSLEKCGLLGIHNTTNIHILYSP